MDVADYPKNVVWAPMAGSQQAFLASTPIFEVLMHGTRGGGKTDCLLMSFCQFVGKGFGAAWKGVLFRQTYKQLSDVVTKTKKWIPQIWPQAKFNHSDYTWNWPTGEQLLLRQFLKPDDYWNYHGHEYPWIGWEELTTWATDEGYRRMFSCCRSPMPGMPRMVRSTTNPYGPGHGWVKARFRLPTWSDRLIRAPKDEEGRPEPDRLAIKSHILENRILLEQDPGYIDRLAASARNSAEKKAWMEGDWDVVAGGMFDDVWSRKHNVIEPFVIPSSWRIARSFDWGSSRPFSLGWWARSDGSDVRLPSGRWRATVRGDVFRIAEWYGWTGKPDEGLRLLATDISRGVIDREFRMGFRRRRETWCRVKGGVADSQIFAVENGNCVATDLKSKVRMDDGFRYPGLYFDEADKRPGSRKTGWDLVRQMMKDARPEYENMPRERPGLYAFDTCEHFQRIMPTLPRDPKDQDDTDTESEDHVADETRYFCRWTGTTLRTGKVVGAH